MNGADEIDLAQLLEDAVQEFDLDVVGLASNMHDASLSQLADIAEFGSRLRAAALVQIYARERIAAGEEGVFLTLPPDGYAGYKQKPKITE